MRDEAAIALVLVLVVASAGAGYFVGNSSVRTTTITNLSATTLVTPTTYTITRASTETITSPSALDVYVNANLTSEGWSASVWEESTVPATVNVSVASAFSPLLGNQSAFGYPFVLGGTPCGGGWPIGIGVLEGHETLANLTQGRLAMTWPYSCTTTPGPDFTYFVFSTDNTTVVAGILPSGTETVNLVDTRTTAGLAPGAYTLVGGDKWGHIALTYFTVDG